ncbi:MAG: cysteate synthase [Methanotrichaceae archaeon]
MGEYLVKCLSCGSVQPPYALTCQNDDSLLRTEYFARQLTLRDVPGLWKFYDWLPVKKPLSRVGEKPITYKSRGLSKELGLDNLYISFSGYWPEREAHMPTCSFKDLEAPATMERIIERDDNPVLVVASVGNTARSFAQVASAAGLPLVLVVPSADVYRLWITETLSDSICVVSVNGDYNDAIDLGGKLASQPGFVSEGGARNVARRDGMGVVMLDGVLTMKTLPDHYFQAVGSGTGGIAAWEAALRLIEDGRFGQKLPKLHLAQNDPCAPIYAAWSGSDLNGQCPKGMYDDVLFNRTPPYNVKGGVKDALESTDGVVYAITNRNASEAQNLFEEFEEIDILPAAGIAVAALQQAVNSGAIKRDEHVLLNITGGGFSRLKEERDLNILKCDLNVKPSGLSSDADLLTSIQEVLGRPEP